MEARPKSFVLTLSRNFSSFQFANEVDVISPTTEYLINALYPSLGNKKEGAKNQDLYRIAKAFIVHAKKGKDVSDEN